MDLYIVLGVQRGATPGDIKRAYRRLARRYHPDINPGDREAAARFRQILDAYETLIDPDRRRRYDTGSTARVGRRGDRLRLRRVRFFQRRRTASARPRSAICSRTCSRAAPDASAPTAPSAAPISISKRGSPSKRRGTALQWPVTLTRQEPCRVVRRHRAFIAPSRSRCVACEGSGVVRSVRGHMVFSKNCPHCGGSGRLRQLACETCHGQGVETRAESMSVRIPPGVADGARVRVAGQGPRRRPRRAARRSVSSTSRSGRIRCFSASATTCT